MMALDGIAGTKDHHDKGGLDEGGGTERRDNVPRRRRSDSNAPLDRLDTALCAFHLAERTYRARDTASLHRAAPPFMP